MNSQNSASAMEEPGVPAPVAGKRRSRPATLTAASSVTDAFVIVASATTAEAVRRAHALHAKADPEILHKLRVALRRLRSLYWAYEPLLDKNNCKLQREEFKYLAFAAGKTRDWDVLRDILYAQEQTRPSFDPLLRVIGQHRATALSFSRKTIRSAGVEEILHSALASARQQLDAQAVNVTLAEFAESRVHSAEKSLRKRVKRAIQPDHPDYAALHEVRIAGKKLRYLLEFFAPVLDGSHQRKIALLTGVQEELGKLNDLVVSESLLRQHSFQSVNPEAVKEAAALFAAQKKRRMRAAHKMLRDVW